MIASEKFERWKFCDVTNAIEVGRKRWVEKNKTRERRRRRREDGVDGGKCIKSNGPPREYIEEEKEKEREERRSILFFCQMVIVTLFFLAGWPRLLDNNRNGCFSLYKAHTKTHAQEHRDNGICCT